MKRTPLILITSFWLCAVAWADELKSASRWDIAVKPYKYELQGELVRAVDEYRTAVNQTGIQPSQDRQIRAETDRLEQLLKSRGYYRATLVSAYDEEKQKPRYQIVLGTRYEISKLTVQGNFQPQDQRWQSLEVGDPLSAVRVLAQQTKLRQYIENNACYYNLSVNHEVQLDEETQTAEVTFITEVSEPTTFGETSFVGTDGIDQSFLTRVAGLGKGGCYNRSKIDNAVIALFDTGLFRQVRPTVARDDAGKVVVSFAVEKRKKRSINASAGWKSEQGFGVRGGWLHRDLLGRAQSLALQGSVQRTLQTVSAEVVIPSFYDRRNRFSWLNSIEHIDATSEAYTYASTASLERKASLRDYFEFGIGFQQVDELADTGWSSTRFVRIPLQYQYDSVSDPFNPLGGFRLGVRAEPVFDINDDFRQFFKTGIGLQTFLSNDERATLATRMTWDSLWYGNAFGSNLESIPNTELFYAGGSTSVRGYGYQSIGLPTTSSDETEGGTQRWLFINEFRARINESWGAVAFWDVGSIASSPNQFIEGDWYSGLGIGVRYFTRFAPLRIDVAFPMNKREDDSNFLIYVSLGQAF